MDTSTVGVGAQSSAATASNLIGSDRVEGTAVRRADGSPVGSISRLMIDKPSGHVVYAILTPSGAEAGGERALPWRLLRYNTDLGAYELDLTDEQLRGSPQQGDASFDRAWEEHVHSYFHAEPYWNEAAGRATDSPLKGDKG
ncbi:PRC-barrel domain-containing protein [Methylobacterium sp. A54F]